MRKKIIIKKKISFLFFYLTFVRCCGLVSIGAKQRRLGDGVIFCKHDWNNCSIIYCVWISSILLQWIIFNNNSSIWWRFFKERPFIAAFIHAHASRLGRIVNVFNSINTKNWIKKKINK